MLSERHKMKVTLDIPDAQVATLVKSILENLPECCYSLSCVKYDYEDHVYHFIDEEENNKKYVMRLPAAIDAYAVLVHDWLQQGTYTLDQLLDDGYWDAPMIDALVQQATLGEVLYG